MTTDQLRALAQRYLAARLDAARTDAAINITAAPSNPIGLDVRADQLTEELHGYERGFATNAQQNQLRTLADALIREAGLNVDRESDAYRSFLLWLLKAKQDAAGAELQVLYGDLSPMAFPAAASETTAKVAPTTAESVLLSAAASRYMEFKRTQGAWTTQTEEMHARPSGCLAPFKTRIMCGSASIHLLVSPEADWPPLGSHSDRP